VEFEASSLKNKFDLDRDRGNIKAYISDLTVIENEKPIFSRQLKVNKPLRYKGFRFYQNSFDPSNPQITASVDSVELELSRISDGKTIDTLLVPLNQKIPLPNGALLQVSNFLPDFRLSGDTPISASAEMNNPAVQVKVFQGDRELYHQWLFLLHEFHSKPVAATYSFRFLNLAHPIAEAKYKTILEIRENKGYFLIWIGIIICTLGIILSFYFTPRHLKVLITGEGDDLQISMGGYSPRAKIQFAQEFTQLVNKIKK
jgi:cytochrome c biogenesis protein